MKNKAPMEIDFGRSPRWNCHDDDRDAAPESSSARRPTASSPKHNWIDRDAHFSDYDGDEDISQQHPSTVAPLAEGNFYSEGVQVRMRMRVRLHLQNMIEGMNLFESRCSIQR